MKKVFHLTLIILMRELSWRCFRHKIDWRRLFLLVSIFTASGFVFQMIVHTSVISPNKHFHFPPGADSYKSSNSTIQSNEFIKETILQNVHLTLPNSAVSPKLSNNFVQSVSVEADSINTEARRKKDRNLANTSTTVTTSFPRGRVPSGKQVEVDWILDLVHSCCFFFKYMMKMDVTNILLDMYIADGH